jgi:hypothetical protein
VVNALMKNSILKPTAEINYILNLYKKELSSIVRYARFMKGESVKDWVYFLGPDAILLDHGKMTADLAQKFMLYNSERNMKLSDSEQMTVFIAAHIHDWGELIIEEKGVGDISYDKKLPQHLKKEKKVFDHLLTQIPQKENLDFLRDSYYSVAMNKSTYLGKMFNAVERIGFMEVALNVYKGRNGKKIENHKGLVGNVLSNQITRLIKYSIEYPYVSEFICRNKHLIHDMFSDTLSIKNVPTDIDGNDSFDKERLVLTFESWRENG